MSRPSARPVLLEAAARLAVDEGVTAVTFDAVAAAAGVSKGGVLYHFPTKHHLLDALVDDVLNRFEAAVEARAASDARPAAWARAYVDATFDLEVSRPDVAVALLHAASDVAPRLLERCAARFEVWQMRLVGSGLPAATATLVRYACDGWWTFGGVGSAAVADGTVLRHELHRAIDEAVS